MLKNCKSYKIELYFVPFAMFLPVDTGLYLKVGKVTDSQVDFQRIGSRIGVRIGQFYPRVCGFYH